MRILCHLKPFYADYLRIICSSAFPGDRISYFSDFRSAVDEELFSRRLYRFYEQNSKAPPAHLSKDAIEDVVLRCRLLRDLPLELAVRLLNGAAWAIEDLLDRSRPDLVVALPVDNYILHLLRLLTAARDVPYLGFINSFINGYAHITASGELVRFREPGDEECETALGQLLRSSYRPSYNVCFYFQTPGSLFVNRYLRAKVKQLYFGLKRRLADPINYHAWVTQLFSAETGKLGYIRVLDYWNEHWKSRIEEQRGCKVLFAPQYYPECTIDYWCNCQELVRQDLELADAVKSTAGKITVVFKEHPAMVGLRSPGVYSQIHDLPNVILVPPHINSNDLIMRCDGVVTWTSTVGFEAALRSRPVVNVGTPYYQTGPMFHSIWNRNGFASVGELITQGGEKSLTEIQRRDMVRHILSGCVPGTPDYIDFRSHSAVSREQAMALGRQIGSHLPAWLAAIKGLSVAPETGNGSHSKLAGSGD